MSTYNREMIMFESTTDNGGARMQNYFLKQDLFVKLVLRIRTAGNY